MEQIIQIPDTLEIKEVKGNTIVLTEKKKHLTYEDIAEKLFYNNPCVFYSNAAGDILNYRCSANYAYPNNCLSKKQGEKLLAFNKLMNVAKYLNEGWQPNWKDNDEGKYYIALEKNKIKIRQVRSQQSGDIYFKTEELAQQAVAILGEETIRTALCTDY